MTITSRVPRKPVVLSVVLIAALVSWGGKTPLEEKIAQKHRILKSDGWGSGHRIIFDFGGRRGWVVEPKVAREDRPWCWTMQWMGAFLNRTGAPELVKRGFFHVHLEAFDTKCDETGLEALAAFQRYLVEELGFAPKANLIGMSWGGFYSIRYAARYPQNVRAIYLDAPLLDLNSFDNKGPGPWAKLRPADGNWSADPRMPVNLAAPVARAGIPILLLYGGADTVVKPKENCETFIPRFKAAGGDITVVRRGAYKHHPHGVDAKSLSLIVDFLDGRRLLWSDEFNGTSLDTNIWQRIGPGSCDWDRHMSKRPDLVEMRDGCLVLVGTRNSDTNADPRPYLTGGVWNKCADARTMMTYGRVEIRAKFEDAKGAWPAFWMMPNKPDAQGRGWPWNGEIDIVERLNGDPFVWQTVHSGWTKNGHADTPPSHRKAKIRPGEFNVYGLERTPKAIIWSVNGAETFRYERTEGGDPDQWPFTTPFYFLLDMQLGGDWVGKVDANDLPVRTWIDWIRVYDCSAACAAW